MHYTHDVIPSGKLILSSHRTLLPNSRYVSTSKDNQVRDFLSILVEDDRSLRTMIIHLITFIVRGTGRKLFDYGYPH